MTSDQYLPLKQAQKHTQVRRNVIKKTFEKSDDHIEDNFAKQEKPQN